MEVYPRSSWFLLLLGFALIAATLQGTTDCPTPEQVSCTSGTKCSSDEDCQSKEICCANACYTKRCIPTTNGVQGEAETHVPSETDCRPYIEKALKELEIGEAAHAQKDPLDKDESVEDVPTVEITDDSSYQEEVHEEQASEEAEGGEDKSREEEATQQEVTKRSTQDAKSEEDLGETPDEKKVESEEKAESEEATAEPSKEESAEQTEQADKASLEEESKKEQVVQRAASTSKKAESPKAQEIPIVQREAPTIPVGSLPVQVPAISKEESDEKPGKLAEERESAENQKESQETGDESTEVTGAEKSEEKSTEESEEDEQKQPPSKEQSEDQKTDSAESAEGVGCPAPEQVSCTEGELCSKHRHCGENQICCRNKCYRKRCTTGTVAQDELDAESASEESKETKSEEKVPSSTSETGCPPPSEVSCTEGELCNKHKQCEEDKICCPNKCYRRRCTPGTATSAELAEESDEDSKEESKEQTISPKATDTRQETGCPPPSEVSCTEGELCSKHRHCGKDEICCPNKCYRRRCTPGSPTSAELAEESEEESKEETQQELKPTKAADTRPATGCPAPSDVSCVEGELCNKHRNCRANKICCPNKCYRKRCIPGTPTEEELEAEGPEEEESEVTSSVDVKSIPRNDTGCPERGEVPCGGEQCNKNKECRNGEICCANKCYRKVCVTGTPGSDEEIEKSEDKTKESAEVAAETESEEEDGGCPSPDKVSCQEGERCSNDEDCGNDEMCCPNKCYNKRCIRGMKMEGDESAEEVVPVKSPTSPPQPKVIVQEKVVKAPPAPTSAPVPKKEPKKPEVNKTEPKISVKPIVVVEPVAEEDESLEKGADAPVEELSLDTDIPTDLRSRDHVEHLLKLDQNSTKLEKVQNKVYEETLKELKRLYENAIKPLEVLYKYRDLSNRHFGDAEIFSKPLILFMGPWSGGKSSIINYLVNNEYNETALRTGAEPSPAYFNILMYGDEPEIIDGTELAADFTFSGLQKFGQGLEERLRGIKVPAKLLEKVNIVEIPGILEVRKQVSRVFPFNDACQWFIDRADIIFLVYDPSKLDVGPETEAILDQLKGREHQTRIILNKADQVKPEELMRVQGALIWNISPLMSSPQPPVMYTASLWSRPYEPWAPVRLLQAQERAFLRDLRTAVDRRVENKIASARRFAVRVRNHAKMVDCYLTTYYNHKSVFGNRKQVANEIIEHPQNYHIYEGLSTLTNISRYDLPDPDVYRDFFKLNPLYEFQQLSATCTYFRGCPINRLDIAIAYDLPELVGTYKRHLEEALTTANNPPKEPTSPSSTKTKTSAPGS